MVLDRTQLIPIWTNWSIPGGSSPLQLYSVKLMSPGFAEFWAKTTVVDYEEVIDGAVVAGGIGSSSLGIGGYDLRTIKIKNFEVDKEVTNLSDSEKNTITVRGDICTLPEPGVSSLAAFADGWTPSGAVTYTVSAKDLNHTQTYWTGSDTESPSAPDSEGKVGEFEAVWDSVGTDDKLVTGFHCMEAKAQGPNAATHGGTSSTRDSHEEFITYNCACAAGANSICAGELCYVSFDYDKLPASPGYGWTSGPVAKVEEIGDNLFYKGSAPLRWRSIGGDFVPFDPSNYMQAAKDAGSTSARYTLTSKDQTIQEFDADGMLRRIVDRNGNVLTYSYNSTTGYLETVSDGNGRSRHYTTRADGQPLTMRENDATTGRLTAYTYYPDTDPDTPDRLHKVIDPEGNETEYLYYVGGPLMAVIDPEGLVASFYEYDEYGRLIDQEIYGERRRLYEYLSDQTMNRNQVRVQDRNIPYTESRWHYEYRDRYGNTIRTEELTTLPPPDYSWVFRTTLLEYQDPNNPYLLTKEIDHNLNVAERSYTPDGNLKTITDKAGNVTTYVYAEEIDTPLNPKHRGLIREIHRSAVLVEGKLVAYRPTVFEYDVDGNLERVLDAKGQATEITYANDGKVLSVTNRRGHTTEFVYDGSPFTGASRNLLQIKNPKGDSALDGFRSVFFEYDDYDNVISVKDDMNNEIITDYDLLGRVIKVTDPLGAETDFNYGNTLLEEVLLPPNNGTSSLVRKVTMLYDDANRLEEVRRDVDSIGTQEMRVKYGYTFLSQLSVLTRIKNGVERSFTYTYDNFGRLEQVSDSLPSPGINIMAYELHCKGYSTTSARGVRHKMSMDSRCLLREVQVGDVDVSDPLNLEIVAPREHREWDYDELGRMVQSRQTTSRYGESRFGTDIHAMVEGVRYDELDRVVRVSQYRPSLYTRARFGANYGNGPNKFAYAYDPEGNLIKSTDPEGKVTEYTYFRDNLLKEVIIKRPSEPDRVFAYSYDDARRLLAIVYPEDTEILAKFDDGTNTPGSGWDAKGQLLHIRYNKDGTLIRRFAFSYDESGNRASQLDVTPAKAIKWEYVYDWLDRLEVVKRAEAIDVASLPGTIPTVSIYTYDASDNRIEFRVEQEDLTYRYEVDDADNLTELHLTAGTDPEVLIETFEHDADGNMISRTNELTDEVITYGWDDFNKLVKVGSAISSVPTSTVKESNRYDLKGIRRWKKDKSDNTSNEFAAGISTVASKAASSGSSAPTVSYLMGHQLLGAEVNGNFQYFLPDALGTVRHVVDENGDVIQSYEFNEHGLPMPGSGAGTGTFSPKTYQGGLSVNDDTADSGLWLMGHRHFDSDLGRFLSRDPIGFRGGLNLFGTGFGNNPVTFVDPSGLNPYDPDGYYFPTLLMPLPPRPAPYTDATLTVHARFEGHGHAWLEFVPQEREFRNRGFACKAIGLEPSGIEIENIRPNGSADNRNGQFAPSINRGTGSQFEYSMRLDEAQLKNFEAWLNAELDAQQKGKTYNIYTNECVDFVGRGLEAVGTPVDMGLHFLGISWPEELRNALSR